MDRQSNRTGLYRLYDRVVPRRIPRRPSGRLGGLLMALAGLCAAPGATRAGVAPVAGASAAGNAVTTLVNFEDQPVSDPSTFTSLPLAGGLLTLVAPDPQAFGIQDLSALQIPGAQSFGARSVQPDLYDQPAPLTVNLSQPASAFKVDFGDASDTPDLLSLKAFSGPDGTGRLLASQTGTLNSSLNAFAVRTLGVSGQGIRSVQFVGGPSGMNSTFYDNLSVTTSATSGGPSAVPLPPAVMIFPAAALMAWAAGRRLTRAGQLRADE